MPIEKIPKLIHQMWISDQLPEQLPEQLQAWSMTWMHHHQEYEYRLWTHLDIINFIEIEFPEWAEVFRNLTSKIAKIYLSRYLILYRYGGVYADLDEECIASIDPIISDCQFVLGEEPVSHLNQSQAIKKQLTYLLCPSVIASIPKHPFLTQLLTVISQRVDRQEEFIAEGAFLLSWVYANYKGPAIKVMPAKVFYPFDKFQIVKGAHKDPQVWVRATSDSISVHYWEGAWWRKRYTQTTASLGVVDLVGSFDETGLGRASEGTAQSLKAAGLEVRKHKLFSNETEYLAPPLGNIILVHTNPDLLLMALRQGSKLAKQIIQSKSVKIGLWAWEGREAMRSEWRKLASYFSEIWLPSRFCVDALMNRLPVSMRAVPHAVIGEQGTCSRHELGLPVKGFCYLFMLDGLSNFDRKNPIGLLHAYRAAFPQESADQFLVLKVKNLDDQQWLALNDAVAKRQDVILINKLLSDDQVASLLDVCDAYISLHRAEGFGLTIAEAMARRKPVIVTGYSGNLDFTRNNNAFLVPYEIVRLEAPNGMYPAGMCWAEPDHAEAVKKILEVRNDPQKTAAVACRAADYLSTYFSPQVVGKKMLLHLQEICNQRSVTTLLPVPNAEVNKQHDDQYPLVVVMTPMRDTQEHLSRYFDLLNRMDYPASRLRLAILEGDSQDKTYEKLIELKARHVQRFDQIKVFQQHHGVSQSGPRWDPKIQRHRRSLIAKARNRLLSLALNDEDYVLWLDADLLDYPANLLQTLLAADRDIVVPNCCLPDDRPFDLNTFIFISRDDNLAEREEYLFDGLYQPPSGVGRIYLTDIDKQSSQKLVRVDAVGGTALLVKADLHRDGIMFPAWPHRGYIETEGFAMIAHDMGVQSWAIPRLKITHYDK